MRKFLAGLIAALLLGGATFVFAQKLGRTTPMAGGPPGQGFLADYDSGMTTLPTGATALVTASTVLVTNIYCLNIDTVSRTVTITDNQGSPQTYVPASTITVNTVVQYLNSGKGIQMKGIRWSASAANGINCQISGYY